MLPSTPTMTMSLGKLPPQSSHRPGCSDDSAPTCDSSCCTTTTPTRPNQSNKMHSHKKDTAATTSTPEEDESEIKDLLLIGAGCHGHAIMLRLLEPDPDFLSDKERHMRGESTDRMRPIKDVTQHIKNLSRGQRATLRSKSKKSKKKNKGDSTSPDPPPHLKLKEVQQSVLVVDSHGGWMQAWKDNFESLRIPKLRSLMNAHTDPFDHRSLEYYAEAKGRGDELVTLTTLSQRDKNFKGPYQVPSTSIFNSFHDLLSKAYGIEDIVRTGTVLSINPTQEDGNADEPIFEVQIAFGKQKPNVRTVKTKRIVCSMGPIFRASQPRWLHDLAPQASERVLHAHQICPYLKQRSKGKNNTDDVSKKKILIVGGGLTSAQLALLATESNWCTEVTLIQRSKMNPRHFDIGNEWMGPKRGKLLEDFWCLDVYERVKKLKETRGGGTIPPEVILELAAKQGKKLEVREEVEVTNVQLVDGRLQVFLDDATEPNFYDMIWLAIGAQNHIDHYSALSHLRQVLPVDVVNGFPVLNTDLSWRAPTVEEVEESGIDEPTWKQVARKRIWLTGALAALQLGPDALNLVGARHGSVRIARAIRQDIAQTKAAASLKEDEHDCDCFHC